jgi:putative ABC transport system permease protein
MRRWDIHERVSRVAVLLRRARLEKRVADQLGFDRAMGEEPDERTGVTANQPASRVPRDRGGVKQWTQGGLYVRLSCAIEDVWRDLALAGRTLLKTPGFTLVALSTLTLAIGANTAVFSLLEALLLRPVALPTASRLVLLHRKMAVSALDYRFSYPLLKEVESATAGVLDVFAFCDRKVQFQGPDGVELVSAQLVSGRYFSSLQARPLLGRWLGPADDRRGAPDGAAAVVSERFWRQRLGAAPHAVGAKIALNRVPFTVVGVMPDRFRGVNRDQQPDVFVPFEMEPLLDAPFSSIECGASCWWFEIGGLEREGVTLERLNSLLQTSSPQLLRREMPPGQQVGKTAQEFLVAESGELGFSDARLRFRRPMAVLMGLVTLVVLVACLNVATLLAARGAVRAREMATRRALGASRGRVFQQMVSESAVLASAGTLLGVAVAPAAARLIVTLLSDVGRNSVVGLRVSLDPTVLAFTAGVATLATLVTGAAPAWRASGNGLFGSLRTTGAVFHAPWRWRGWPGVLLGLEVAFALVLVAGAGLLGRSLLKLRLVPIGFEPRGVVSLELDVSRQDRRGAELMALYQALAEDVRRLPDVTGVSFAAMLPLDGSSMTDDVSVPGEAKREAWLNRVGPGYFEAMRTPLLSGREFRWDDTKPAGPVAIVSEAAARLLYSSVERALGRQIVVGDQGSVARVVGVVGDARHLALRKEAPPTVYLPMTQDPVRKPSYTLLVRAGGPSRRLVSPLTQLVRSRLPGVPAPIAVTMDQLLDSRLAVERTLSTLALFFGVLALLITGVGLYGTLAYATECRTVEIGVRIALGARPCDVVAMVCRENAAIVTLGCGAGIVGAAAVTRVATSLLYDVSARDPLTFAGAALALVGVSMASSLVPAARAARIEPMAALRRE